MTASPEHTRSGQRSLIVLGVDPGTLVTGFGVIERRKNDLILLNCGTIHNRSIEALPHRLKKIYNGLCDVIKEFKPDEFAIESAFYGKNAQSALKLGHARGVSILAAIEQDIPTTEYSPREIKKAVVGNGAASKEQVQFMVKTLVKKAKEEMLMDASDAIAVAVCHLFRMTRQKTKYRDWKSFIAAHPERVKT